MEIELALLSVIKSTCMFPSLDSSPQNKRVQFKLEEIPVTRRQEAEIEGITEPQQKYDYVNPKAGRKQQGRTRPIKMTQLNIPPAQRIEQIDLFIRYDLLKHNKLLLTAIIQNSYMPAHMLRV